VLEVTGTFTTALVPLGVPVLVEVPVVEDVPVLVPEGPVLVVVVVVVAGIGKLKKRLLVPTEAGMSVLAAGVVEVVVVRVLAGRTGTEVAKRGGIRPGATPGTVTGAVKKGRPMGEERAKVERAGNKENEKLVGKLSPPLRPNNRLLGGRVPRGILTGSTITWHVHGSWTHLSGAFRLQVKVAGHEVAQIGRSAKMQAEGANLISSSTQMLRVHTHGSMMQRRFQSPGHPVGRAPQEGCVPAGHTTPGQKLAPLKGSRHLLNGITAPPSPSTLRPQPLQPSIVQLEIFTPLQSIVLQMNVEAGQACGPSPALQHGAKPLPVPHGNRNPGASCEICRRTGRQVHSS
jgi:hypothetical protein